MANEWDIDPQWDIFDNAYDECEVAHDAIKEAQTKIKWFIDSFCNLSAQAKKVVLEKFTDTEWNAVMDTIENCVKDFDKYANIIGRGLKNFETLMNLSMENVDEELLQITEKVVESIISVQIETEDRMKDVQEIIEKIGNPSPLDES